MRLKQSTVVFLLLMLEQVVSLPVEQVPDKSLLDDSQAKLPENTDDVLEEKSISDVTSDEVEKQSQVSTDTEDSTANDDDEIIRGKYIFMDVDGMPAEVEYEASPDSGFNIKSFKKDTVKPKVFASPEKDSNEDEVKDPEIPKSTELHNEEVAEEMFPGGFVRGLFTYMEEDGVPASIEYEASPDIGFVVKSYIKGDAPSSDGQTQKLSGTESIDHSSEQVDLMKESSEQHQKVKRLVRKRIVIVPSSTQNDFKQTNIPLSTQENPQEYSTNEDYPKKTYSNTKLSPPRSSVKNFKITEADEPVEEEEVEPVNASYRFGFDVDDQSRHEESDSEGNVKGSYSYIDRGGLLTKVEYEAGAGRGFVIKKMTHEHTDSSDKSVNKNISQENLSKQDKVEIMENNKETTAKNEMESSSKDAGKSHSSELPSDSNEPSESRQSIYVTPSDGIPWTRMDNPYPYSHVLARGYSKKSAPFHQVEKNQFSNYGTPYGPYEPTSSMYELPNTMEKRVKHFHKRRKNRPTVKPAIGVSTHRPNQDKPHSPTFTGANPDGSYAFSYKTKDHSREEAIDAEGNIHYSYQFKNQRDGNTVVIFNTRVNKNTMPDEANKLHKSSTLEYVNNAQSNLALSPNTQQQFFNQRQ